MSFEFVSLLWWLVWNSCKWFVSCLMMLKTSVPALDLVLSAWRSLWFFPSDIGSMIKSFLCNSKPELNQQMMLIRLRWVIHPSCGSERQHLCFVLLMWRTQKRNLELESVGFLLSSRRERLTYSNNPHFWTIWACWALSISAAKSISQDLTWRDISALGWSVCSRGRV